jgi:hypothetical protein
MLRTLEIYQKSKNKENTWGEGGGTEAKRSLGQKSKVGNTDYETFP